MVLVEDIMTRREDLAIVSQMSSVRDALKKMKAGEVSQPVKTRFGYHIIWLKNRAKPQPKPFEQLTDKEKTQVMQQFFRTMLEKKIEELKAKASITVQK